MLKILSYQGKANQTAFEIPSKPVKLTKINNTSVAHARTYVKQREYSCVVDGSATF